jgi:hypothetical protein
LQYWINEEFEVIRKVPLKNLHTHKFGKNIIGVRKMQNNYGAIKL